MKIRVLVNPKAGAGSASRKIPEIVRELERRSVDHDVVLTRRSREAETLANAARDDGVDCLLVVGGDGTLNEVVQSYVDAQGRARGGPDLALIPAGTGGDFRRTFDLPRDVGEAVARLTRGDSKAVDLGVLELSGPQGEPVRRAFVNVMSFGLGGLTDRIVNAGPKWMGGKAAFFLGATRALLVYRNAKTRVTIDGQLFYEGPIVNVAVANGRFFGGGMLIAPDADPTDGLFDVIAIGDLTRMQSLMLSGRIYQGTHVSARGVSVGRGKRIEARPLTASGDILVDMDGETPGRLPLCATLLPGALRLRI